MKLHIRVIPAVLISCMICSLSGCIGTNAITAKLMRFNLRVVDNRYARGGVNFLLSPVYALTAVVDALIFNSIEFWAGKNPINGKPHIFDSDIKTIYQINDDVDPSLQEAPIKSGSDKKEVSSAVMIPMDEDTLEFTIVYTNGEKAVLCGRKNGDRVTFEMNGEFVTTATMAELKAFVTPRI